MQQQRYLLVLDSFALQLLLILSPAHSRELGSAEPHTQMTTTTTQQHATTLTICLLSRTPCHLDLNAILSSKYERAMGTTLQTHKTYLA